MKLLVKGLLPILVLATGIGAGLWFFSNPEEAQKRPRPEARALLVETGRATTGAFSAKVEAMGQVIPSLSATLKPQVSGEIVEAAPEFLPGGFFQTGETILRIDPADYELAVKRQEAILRQAKADLDLEMGRQSVAQEELGILERSTGRKPENTALALRGPQLAQAQAELDKAQADLERARLDLERARVTAPFNALVTSRAATLGDRVSAGQSVATLARTDEYWVEISVPVHDLRWLDIPLQAPDAGSPATVILDGGRGERRGHLFRLTGSLDEGSRMATLLVSVPDPLLRGESAARDPRLILGDYVKVVLEGRKLEGALRLPLLWVRDGDTIWLNEAGRLAFRRIEVVYRDRDHAYVTDGLSPDDNIVTSDISVPVEGMRIRTDETETTR
ncbi:MAG: efflux RND transporter periplasmic adaptor subunit [Alphaproteobacteria bacterium]|nr:efflux RND transporter periplasmic adaptor subunit [Alphaproteobacteria bacterium]